MGRGHPLLVFHLEVRSFVDEVLYHLEAVVTDGVVDGPLILGVQLVVLTTKLN